MKKQHYDIPISSHASFTKFTVIYVSLNKSEALNTFKKPLISIGYSVTITDKCLCISATKWVKMAAFGLFLVDVNK